MISTVTTSTVASATVVMGAGLSLLAILTLLSVLIPKEIVSASDNPRMQALSRALNIALIPLMMGFVFIAVVKVLEVLR